MPTLEEIVKDSQNFADDLQWQLADGTVVTLGDVRNKFRAYDQGFTKKTQELAEQRKRMEAEIQAKQQEFANAYAALQQQQAQIQEQMQTLQSKGPQGIWEWERPDDYIKPVVERFNSLDPRLQQIESLANNLQKTLLESARWIAQRELRRDFDSLADRPEDVTIEQLYQYATENRITDPVGFPDIRKAYETVMAPRREEMKVQEAEKRGYEKARKEIPNAPFVPRPGAAGRQSPTQQKAKNLDERFSMLRQDPDVLQQLNRAFGLGES